MPEADAMVSKLETVFRRIHEERMADVPILNPRLTIEAVGARPWNGYLLAGLVTPWFINLMLLPDTDEQRAVLDTLSAGAKVLHRFPAGRFEFIVGEEPSLGRYEMCSLFSPVLEFENQEAARLTASAALGALFDATLDPAAETDSRNAPAPNRATASSDDRQPKADEAVNPSRRGFLTGHFEPQEGPG